MTINTYLMQKKHTQKNAKQTTTKNPTPIIQTYPQQCQQEAPHNYMTECHGYLHHFNLNPLIPAKCILK